MIVKIENLRQIHDLLRKGVKFYTPTGILLRSFKEVFHAWPVYGQLYFRRKHAPNRIWILNQDGKVSELL